MIQPSTMSPALLTKALIRATEQLGVAPDLAALLQVSEERAAELRAGAQLLTPEAEEWGRALRLVSLFRSLLSLVGTTERARAWLGSPNQALGAPPLELLRGQESQRVFRYLDAVLKNELRLPPRWRHDHRGTSE